MEKLAISVSECSKLISIGKSTCYAMCEQNLLPHIHITSKRIIIPVAQLHEWISKQSSCGYNRRGFLRMEHTSPMDVQSL